MTRSSNFGSGGGEEAIFRNEENGAAYEDYRVIFRGSLFDNRGNERRAANSLPLLPAGGCQQAPRPGVGKLDWHTVREVVMKVSNRAFLEEADSDVTGLTKRLYVPRCSYVPIREVSRKRNIMDGLVMGRSCFDTGERVGGMRLSDLK